MTGPRDPESDEERRCSTCGDRVDSTEWHPAATSTDEDGSLQVLVFCSRECRDEHRTMNDTTETNHQ